MKMLGEEKALRRHLHQHYIVATKYDRELSRLLRAFRLACYEDAAKVAENVGCPNEGHRMKVAASIRARGKG